MRPDGGQLRARWGGVQNDRGDGKKEPRVRNEKGGGC